MACPSCVDMLNIGTLFGNQWVSHMVVATNGFGSRVGIATENPLATLDVDARFRQLEKAIEYIYQTASADRNLKMDLLCYVWVI